MQPGKDRHFHQKKRCYFMMNYESVTALAPYRYRHYHNFNHLHFLRNALSKFINIDLKKDLLIAFHDIVYTAGAKNNEELSMLVFKHYFENECLGISNEEAVFIFNGIETSKFHSKSYCHEVNLFLDADMCILGSPEHDYDLYSGNIRKEYSFFSDDEYKVGRVKFLNSFDRYITDEFNDSYLSQTKSNIARELCKLGA